MQKLINKYTPKKSTIPVLQFVHVKDNLATITNLDYWLTLPAPCNMQEGLYSPIGLYEGFPQNAKNTPLSEFPIRDKPDELITIQIVSSQKLLDKLQFVAPAMAKKEEVRYYLKGICFSDTHLVANDGVNMNIAPLGFTLPADHRPIITADAIRLLIDVLKRKDCPATTTITFNKETTFFNIGDINIFARSIEAAYPDYARFIPSLEGRKITAFSTNEFKAIEKKARMLAKQEGKKQTHILIKQEGIYYGDTLLAPCSLDVGENVEKFNLDAILKATSGKAFYEPRHTLYVQGCGGWVSILIPMLPYKTYRVQGD